MRGRDSTEDGGRRGRGGAIRRRASSGLGSKGKTAEETLGWRDHGVVGWMVEYHWLCS